AERVSDPVATAAERIGRGEIVGVVQGRFEWGPRALGQRSLLASPAPLSMRERINRAIKRREDFQPFAPAVLSADVGAWFGPHAELLAPYMTTVADVQPAAREALAAVTHVDGSARLQTVANDSFLGRVLGQLRAAGHPPVVLNTSLNGRGEPIAAAAADALHFFVSHRADALLVEDMLVTRSNKP
ncbi:MAG TPA: carbamoyltransferase C-terminal domain-containing protein, partial [Polyangiales bacterium]|nr:carbamoyltransferase C-terminal domain-containing protein [Polyangiales bacterium]